MGLTIEIYSAEPQALVALFAAEVDGAENDERFFEQVKAYPMADFSFHLQLPKDLDGLSQLLSQQDRRLPPIFRDLFVEQIWNDGPVVTESLTTLADVFAESLVGLSEQAVENVARNWAATFPYQEPFWQTLVYRAVWQLQAVARDAAERRRSLVLHLAGHPLF